jgi:hypothetical protein
LNYLHRHEAQHWNIITADVTTAVIVCMVPTSIHKFPSKSTLERVVNLFTFAAMLALRMGEASKLG